MPSRPNSRCRECGHSFTHSKGPITDHYVLRCVQCGRERPVSIDKACSIRTVMRAHRPVETISERCPCGGSYTTDAPPRCPECKSVRLDEMG